MNELPIYVKCKLLKEGARLPERATDGSAGYDLQYVGKDPITLLPGQKELIPLGLAMHIDDPGIVAFILPRSKKGTQGLVLKNTVGVIDSDYTGEWCVSAWNSNNITSGAHSSIVIQPYEKIAQVVFLHVPNIYFLEADELAETQRNGNGITSSSDTGV